MRSHHSLCVVLIAANDGPGQEVVGKPVRKKFGNKLFSGTVENFDPEAKWYKVRQSGQVFTPSPPLFSTPENITKGQAGQR